MLDEKKLLSLGFTQVEIQHLKNILINGGKFTPQALQSYGYTPEQAKRLRYMYNVCTGKVVVESREQMMKHLKKNFGPNYKLRIEDLSVSNVNEVPRVAVVANITDVPFNIWNSNQYQGKDRFYRVIGASSQGVTVETSRKPQLDQKHIKKIPGVLEIKGVKANGNVVITFDKNYCKMCNRYVIVASLKRPEFHMGMYDMLCFEGTRVYVYCTDLGIRESVKHNGGNSRVYDYGILPNMIKPKLDKIAKSIYQNINCIDSLYIEPNKKFNIIHKETSNSSNTPMSNIEF